MLIVAPTNGNAHLNPRLREIALRIVTKPGFDGSDKSLTRALEEWRKALTPEDWRFTADVLMCRYLLGVRYEYDKGLPVPRQRTPDPQPPRAGVIRFVDAVVEPEPEPELAGDPADEADDAPGPVLRHSSESEDWSGPPTPEKAPEPERNPAPPKRKTPPPTPEFGPVVVSHVSDRVPEPEPQPEPAPVQPEPEAPAAKPVHIHQDGWRGPALRNMFPSLALGVTINGVAMREGEMKKPEIAIRRDQIALQRWTIRDKDAHSQARIRREDEAIRVRRAQDRELEAENNRLSAVERVLPDGAAIAELAAETLIECGYERRAA